MTKSTKSAPSRHQVSVRYHDGSIRLRVPSSDEWGTTATEHSISFEDADRLMEELFSATLEHRANNKPSGSSAGATG